MRDVTNQPGRDNPGHNNKYQKMMHIVIFDPCFTPCPRRFNNETLFLASLKTQPCLINQHGIENVREWIFPSKWTRRCVGGIDPSQQRPFAGNLFLPCLDTTTEMSRYKLASHTILSTGRKVKMLNGHGNFGSSTIEAAS